MMTGSSGTEQQVETVIRLLDARKLNTSSPAFGKALEWIRFLDQSSGGQEINAALRRRLIASACASFELTEAQLILAIEGNLPTRKRIELEEKGDQEKELERLIPKGGFMEAYVEMTRYNESPMSYHVAASLTALGAAVGRRCWLDMGGVFRVNGNCSSLLIGPTGKVKKTTAIDFAGNFVREGVLCPMLNGKATAEALAQSFVDSSTLFVCAPEFSVFLGRQKYLDGLTPLILRLLDDPADLEIKTLTRGAQIVEKPTLSLLGGSTMSLLTSSTADEVLSGGFLNRMLVVVEENTDRIFPMPRLGKGKDTVVRALERVKNYEGAVSLGPENGHTFRLYESQYISRVKMLRAQTESTAEVMQRGTNHWLRVAMLHHLAHCGLGDVCERCMQFGIDFVSFLEKKLPDVAKAMDRNQSSQDSEYVLRVLRRLGGAADHSTLLRRVANKMNSTAFRQVAKTLEESGWIKIRKRGNATEYILEDGEEKE